MPPSRCLFSPSTALQRVFLAGFGSPIASTSSGSVRLFARTGRSYATNLAATTRLLPPPPTIPTINDSNTTLGRRGYAKLVRPPKQKQKSLISNNDIPYQWVRIKQENRADEEGDILGPAQRTDDILRKLDMSRYALVMLAPPPPPRAGEQSAAICKLVNLEQEAQCAEEQKKEARQAKANSKELEFNWAIAKGDMDMKINRMADFLRKGMRVDVTLAKKRGSRAATVKEAQQLVANIQEAVTQVPFAKEIKKPDGTPGKVVRMSFEGPTKNQREQLAANAAEAEARAQAKAKEEAVATQE